MTDVDPLVREFLVESYENLDRLDQDFVALEQNPRDEDRLRSVFRTIHTIKGTCGFFGFSKLESVTHVGENLLCRLRDGELVLTPEITSALLALVDVVRELLARIETTSVEGDGNYTLLTQTLTRLAEQEQALPEPVHQAVPTTPTKPMEQVSHPTPTQTQTQVQTQVQGPSMTTEELARSYMRGEPAPAPLPAPHSTKTEGTCNTETGQQSVISEANVRVDVTLLDKLMTLVGELVLARNQLLQCTQARSDPALTQTSQRLNLIATELQAGVMKTRMQQIGGIWNRFPRVVRDLANQCGKQIRLEMEGQTTELDRTIIEAIKDPLTHVIRNAVDHGIESPEVRVARGKPAEGRLSLRAYHEGGQVNIEITDDGGGIDPEKVRNKAASRGLIERDRLTQLTDREVTNLIFLPGFSTAETVTNVSGRGVGMDVVKTNIERIGGSIDLQTRPGHGTTMKIKIPLTLAIIPAVVVTTGGDRYCVPQVNLVELVRLEREQARKGIEWVHKVPVYRLRGQLLPLVDLNQKLGLPDRSPEEAVNIVVVRADERSFGLVVDGVNDTEEIVVKPLSKHLKSISAFAGATIMGDGRVSLILDVPGLAPLAESESRNQRIATDREARTANKSSFRHLLLAGVGSRRVAIPLDLVSRLEEIETGTIEDCDGREVVQYRERIMPLVRLADALGCSTDQGEEGTLQVVVYTSEDRSVGLIVDRILDIVEAAVELDTPGRRAGVIGSAVVQKRVTDLLDLPAIVQATVPEIFEEAHA